MCTLFEGTKSALFRSIHLIEADVLDWLQQRIDNRDSRPLS